MKRWSDTEQGGKSVAKDHKQIRNKAAIHVLDFIQYLKAANLCQCVFYLFKVEELEERVSCILIGATC